MNRKQLFLLGLVFALLVPLAGAQAQAQLAAARPEVAVKDIDAALHNDWFGTYSESKKIGYMNKVLEKVTENGQTYYRERQAKKEMVQISGQKLVFKHEEILDFDARPPFKLVRGEYFDDDGQVKERVKFAVEGKVCAVTQTTGNVTTKKTQPVPEYTLADSLALTVWLKKGPAKGESVTIREFSIRDWNVNFVTARSAGLSELLIQGMKRKVHEVELYVHDLKLGMLCRFDSEAQLISLSVGGLLEMRRESESDARKIDFGDDLFEFLLARIDRPIGNLRSVTGLVLEARGKEVGSLPDGPRQKIVARGDDTFLVKIGKDHGSKVKATEKEISDGLQETAEYPIHDAKVVELARKAIGGIKGGAKTDEDKVKLLCKFVHDFITPTMGEAGKQAKVHDILERKRGICRHFARLFTCLARAVGVSSREVAGLVYMGDEARSFGPHQWNEVVLDGHWVQIDSVSNAVDLPAGYICFGADKDGEGNLVRTAGKLSFKLLAVERTQRLTRSDPKRHEGEGRVYDKDAGFSIVPPKGWIKDKSNGSAFLIVTGPKEAFTPSLNVIAVDDDGAPIEKLGPLVKESLAKQFKEWKLIDDGMLTIHGRKAYRVCSRFVLSSQGQAHEVQVLQYLVVGSNEKVYILTFAAPSASFAGMRKSFEESALTTLTD